MAERNLDFDTVIDRRNTRSLKYDFAKQRKMPEDVLPLWVADMDFKTSSYVQDALLEVAKHGIFGYSEAQDGYFDAVRNWMQKHYGWEVQRDWLIKTPGVVFALAMAVKAFTHPGDGILIQQPVYYPFAEVINENNRRVVSNTLVYGADGRYHIDFADFEQKIVSENIKLFILCSPHNPVARVWTEEELRHLGDICVRNHVIVVSDEIHADFIFCGRHHVFAGLGKAYEKITVTCTSPGKTFNLAGLQLSNIFIADPELKRRFKKEMDKAGYSQLNAFALAACEAAYEHGEDWYQAVHGYIADNIRFAKAYVETCLPQITMAEQEGTYLVWLDFRKLGFGTEELDKVIIHKAKLWLDSGSIFGEAGRGFQRINAACPRSILKEALVRLRKTFG